MPNTDITPGSAIVPEPAPAPESPARAKELEMDDKLDSSIDDFITEMMRPKIHWPSPWAEDEPQCLKDSIVMDRLLQLMKEGRTGMATYSEVVFYMFPLTMDAPLDHDWVQIYTWCGDKAMPGKMPEGVAPESLSEYQQGMLGKLRRWIWETSVKALKGEARKADAEERRVLKEKGYRFEGLPCLKARV